MAPQVESTGVALTRRTKSEGPPLREASSPSRDVVERGRGFRRQCTALRLPLRDRLRYWAYYIALAHRGEPVHSPTHDTQYADSIYKRGYNKYCEKLNARLARSGSPPPLLEVPSFTQGELSEADWLFLMSLNIPFVVRGGAEGLPVNDWSLEYFEEVAGTATVPINEAADSPSEDTTRPTKSHRYYEFRTGVVSEVIESIRRGGNARVSTAEDVMHHDGGRLREDLCIPYWERVSGWARNQEHWLRSKMLAGKVVGAQLLMQPADAFTLWHSEPGDNFFVLAKGVKTWTLAHPYYTAGLRPRVKTTTNYHGCNIDVREPDEVQRERGFEGYLHVPKVRLTIGPGDVLRVPNYWWHTAVTHPGEYTLAATIRSGGMPNMVGPGLTLLRWFDRKYHAMAVDFAKEGRISDRHIGYPRNSRSADETASSGASTRDGRRRSGAS